MSIVLERHGALATKALLGELLDRLAPVVDVLGLLEDTGPGGEGGEWDTRTFTVGDEILALAGEEEVRLAGGAQVADAVAGIQQRGPVVVVGDLRDGVGVGPDGQALVVPEARVLVQELDGPAVGLVERVARRAELGAVGHDLDVAHQLLAE